MYKNMRGFHPEKPDVRSNPENYVRPKKSGCSKHCECTNSLAANCSIHYVLFQYGDVPFVHEAAEIFDFDSSKGVESFFIYFFLKQKYAYFYWRTEYCEYFWTTVNIIRTWQEKQCRWKVSSPDLMTRAEAGIGWRQRAHWPPPNILRRETKGQRQQRLDRDCPFKRSGQGQGQRPVPAVVQQAVDIPVPAVERGVCLQIALALAASQAAVVPHPACCQ